MNDPQDIALRIKSGDEKAFEQLFRSHYAGMCGYAVKYLTDLDQAEEVVQEVFLTYWEKRAVLDITGSLEAYLFRSVRNACLNLIKHFKVRRQYAEVQMEVGEAFHVSDKVVELELSQKIDSCIDQLPPERKKIFMLSREEGLKYKEIADQLNISVKTVEAQMGKALRFLKENLTEYLPVLIALVCANLLVWVWTIKIF